MVHSPLLWIKKSKIKNIKGVPLYENEIIGCPPDDLVLTYYKRDRLKLLS